MKTFNKIIISFFCLFLTFKVMAQPETCDIATNGIVSTPSIMHGSGTSDITFQVYNAAGGPCEYPVNSVMVIVTLPATGLGFNSFVTPAMGAFFNWSYDMTENIIVGINHTAIGLDEGETITARLNVLALPSNTYPDCRTVVLDIINNPDGPTFPSNTSDGNDGGYTTITVTPAPGSSTVECLSDAVQPVPPFLAPTCSSPVISYLDSPITLTCEGTRTWSFLYNGCAGCPYSSFTWNYTYTIDRTQSPEEVGGPVATSATVNCADDLTTPSLPTFESSCGETLTPGSVILKSQLSMDFEDPVVLAAVQTPGTWYTDRYAPAGFATAVFSGDNRLKQTINAADCQSCRPPAYSSSFYNTQGRKFDLGTGTNYMQIDLFIPSDWSATGRRMAGFWGTAFDGSNAVSAFPIIEFTSDNAQPRFRAWINDWVNLGLPAGFVYDNWVTLKIRLLASGEFLYEVVTDQGTLSYQTSVYSGDNSVSIGNVILQGHNTDAPGVTYDIHWDDFTWRENYIVPSCNGIVSYTYDYTDCSGLVTPWTFIYQVLRTVHPSEDGGPVASSSTVACADLAVTPTTLPVVLASCGEGPLSPGSAILKSQYNFDFTDPVTLAASQTPGAWYTDRYAPAGFSNDNYLGDDRLKHSISSADCEGCRPGGFNTAFYNTQGRKYDLGDEANYMSIDLYIPSSWSSSNKRMAGFWGTALDGSNNISEFPILEFTSDGMNPRFRMWPADPVSGGWVDLGMPSGFVYDSWVKLQVRVLATGEFLFMVNDMYYQTANLSVNGSVKLDNVILQGHNTPAPGVTYDIYWDNFIWRETYSAPPCTGTIAYTFDYVDSCNDLVYPWTYLYNVNDNVVPTWTTAANALDLTVQCSDVAGLAAAQALFPVADDNCDGDVTNVVKVPGAFVAGMTCAQAGTYTNTWTVTDDCGNVSPTYTQVITIIDTEIPTWTTAANALDMTVQCSDVAGLATAQALFPVASDNCDGDVTNVVKSPGAFVAGMTCAQAGTYTNTWTVTDDCGNVSSTYTQVITIIDTEIPTWTTAANALDMTVQCSDVTGLATAQALFPIASDNCDGDVSNIVKVSGPFVAGMLCPQAGSYTNTWTVTDDCGNLSATYTQVITVVDYELPVISLLGDPTTYICYGETYTDAGATASDNCSGDLTSMISVNNPVNTSMDGTYFVTYDVMDNCGNNAIQVVRTVIVRPHPTATISGTATVLQNAPTTPVVTFTGFNGTAPYTFYYSLQYNSDPPTFHWTSPPGNPVTVAQSNAVVGVFTYTLMQVVDVNGCEYDLPAPQPTAVITVISSCDLAPSVPRPINGSFVTAQTKQGVIQFTNAGPGPTNGTMTFRVSNISNFNIIIPAVSGTYDGLSCQNSVFTVTPGTFFTTLTTNAVIPAGGNLRVGYINTAVGTGGANGNLTITINNGTGGDNNNANNKSVRTFIIN